MNMWGLLIYYLYRFNSISVYLDSHLFPIFEMLLNPDEMFKHVPQAPAVPCGTWPS